MKPTSQYFKMSLKDIANQIRDTYKDDLVENAPFNWCPIQGTSHAFLPWGADIRSVPRALVQCATRQELDEHGGWAFNAIASLVQIVAEVKYGTTYHQLPEAARKSTYTDVCELLGYDILSDAKNMM